MSKDINTTTINGRLTRDPELKYTATGMSICNFSIANNQDHGEAQKVNFFDVITWNKLAEVCNQYLKKGSLICVNGQLNHETWEKEGVKHSRVNIIADQVQFLSTKQPENNIENNGY